MGILAKDEEAWHDSVGLQSQYLGGEGCWNRGSQVEGGFKAGLGYAVRPCPR